MLRERHQYDRQSHPHLQNISIVDILLVKNVNLPCLRWKKGHITKLIKGNDGFVRRVSLHQLQTRRSVLIVRYNILYPLNLKIFNN